MPLWIALGAGGIPLVLELLIKLVRAEFGSDLLAGISIVTAIILGEYLAGTLVVLMLSGGQSLEEYALRNASFFLQALAKRIPSVAHRKRDEQVEEIPLDHVAVSDVLLVLPHEICPVDGVVVDGHGVMDESFLTGEPFKIDKAPGSEVISGAMNGESLLVIQAVRRSSESRYAKIMEVMRASEKDSPRLRRLGDQLGAYYTPLALLIAGAAWIVSGQVHRFLAVLVVATPCPLLIAIPVAVIGSISLAARLGIIIKKPIVLEQADRCRTVIFDKTGTLTYGRPVLTDIDNRPGVDKLHILSLMASIERYSKHPLSGAVLRAAKEARASMQEASQISEKPGEGLRGIVSGQQILITSRKKFIANNPQKQSLLPMAEGGLECVIVVNGEYAATLRFHDEVRPEGRGFVGHLRPRHGFRKIMLLSGDRESEVVYLAQRVGIDNVQFGKSPEEKLAIVRAETAKTPTLYVGDGINDAPALLAATVGVALGQNSDITTEAAGAVVLDNSLTKVDEFLHVGHRMRKIALQSALGGMALSVAGMVLASSGLLAPVAGAICQEIIDVLAVLNALRAGMPPRHLTDIQITGEVKEPEATVGGFPIPFRA